MWINKVLLWTIICQNIEPDKKINKLLETYSHLRLNQDKNENLNRVITSKEVESVIKNLSTNKSPGPHSFTSEFYQMFRNLIPILLILFLKTEEEQMLPYSFY